MRQRLYFDPDGWYQKRAPAPTLPQIKEAVWEDSVIEAVYENWSGQTKSVILEPYSLIYKAARWYLAGKKRPGREMRIYRVSRLSNVHITRKRFDRDADFDIESYWGAHCETIP